MPAAIDGHGFEAEISRQRIVGGGDAGFADDRRRQQSAEPGRVL